MTIHYLDGHFIAERHGPAPRAYFPFGLWLRAGFVALSVAAIALMMLAEGEASALTGIATAVAGIVIAAFAWRKAWVLIGRLEPGESSSAETAAAQPRGAGFGAPVEPAALR
jgi:hypothetical protein